MKVDLWNITAVRPYPHNPRRNDHAVATVARLIAAFGFRQPIVVDEDGVIIVGDTRYKAALLLQLQEVPVHVATGLTPAQVKAYRIADNKSAELADWDHDLLVDELAALQTLDFDVDILGFSPEELRELLTADPVENPGDPDWIPEPPDAAVTQPGDLWILDRHRLLCGDSSKPEDVDRLLEGATIQVVNTDPPYGVKVEPRSNNAIAAGLSTFGSAASPSKKLLNKTSRAEGLKHHQALDLARHPAKAKATQKKLRAKDRPLVGDFLVGSEFDQLLRAWFRNIARALQPGRLFFIWGGYSNIGNFPQALQESGLYYSQQLIWVKEHPVLTRKVFLGNHEWCFFGWREGAAHQFFGPNNVPDVWSIKKVAPQAMVHLTEKPVELAGRALQYGSRPGENVLDLFGGSGSTLIAAEQTGRKAFLMEIDPLYCDVIVRRWEQFTGRTAERRCRRAA
jgi:DNA modification methylase